MIGLQQDKKCMKLEALLTNNTSRKIMNWYTFLHSQLKVVSLGTHASAFEHAKVLAPEVSLRPNSRQPTRTAVP